MKHQRSCLRITEHALMVMQKPLHDIPGRLLLLAAGTSEDCVGPYCMTATFTSACCSDGFACLAQLPSPNCKPSPFPVVPPQLDNPVLIVNSTSLVATKTSLALSTSAVLPKAGKQEWQHFRP